MASVIPFPHCSINVIAFILLALATRASAHSNLGMPPAYAFRSCRIVSPWCRRQACPTLSDAKLRAARAKPAAVWRRGQRVRIVWHKNNHNGGFYRRSLVPLEHMYDHAWHAKTAFDYGCWSQGSFKCTKNKVLCGGDQHNRAYANYVTIPSSVPSGLWIFAQVWYGGLHWQKQYPNHSDYFACSIVRIVGNEPVTASSAASWTGAAKKCRTGSTHPLQCGGHCGDACGGPKCPKSAVKTTVPDDWKNGRVPRVYLKSYSSKAVPARAVTPKKLLSTPAKTAKNTKNTANTKNTNNSPLVSIRIFANNRLVKELQDGQKARIALQGKGVAFEAYTGGKRAGTVTFRIDGVADKHVEANPPYVFRGNRGRQFNTWPNSQAIFNRPFKLTVVLQNGKKQYAKSVVLTLTK